ncbi:hypothetical protein CLAFUW4_11536 [Fulvia fulva]|uniref:F-box domain-containing protein n=1 Tax=Passalora fulva TaxID=5499 RepID=A0A9Q8US06_PASFU|nr:uncharacterized protein CLAFUR5_10579 [Fulvia fulva]KAK4619692.1 hypothetical protein CLAFUR4_11542 [Fulvia fulva]KAK4620897.1 hypothetical protein CLAFUR0_11550 [Fulvia fulva]UJO20262.1 hypothetical protein CLAFUR5_10579 [Fulvia fulva]WPV17425.1 hypothetical protein CLAFUW4_11536 [Fulvia fulva]WPV32612.1 hypothetical protein CLAFUW7_11541 [Fulvia fulva]
MTTDAARRAVFETAELLEQIMLELPAFSIFTSQRVCHQFQDIVRTSSKIQEKLFLRVNSTPDRFILAEPRNIATPILRLEEDRERTDFSTVPARVNNMSRSLGESWSLRWLIGDTVKFSDKLHAAMVRLLRDETQKLSCSSMHLADIPILSARLQCEWSVGDLVRGVGATQTTSATGITVGDVVEAMRTPGALVILERVDPSDVGYANHRTLYGARIMPIVRDMEQKYQGEATLTFTQLKLQRVLLTTHEIIDEHNERYGPAWSENRQSL